jgi:hypothetical protein
MSGMGWHPGEVKSPICAASLSLLVDGVIEWDLLRRMSPFV